MRITLTGIESGLYKASVYYTLGASLDNGFQISLNGVVYEFVNATYGPQNWYVCTTIVRRWLLI